MRCATRIPAETPQPLFKNVRPNPSIARLWHGQPMHVEEPDSGLREHGRHKDGALYRARGLAVWRSPRLILYESSNSELIKPHSRRTALLETTPRPTIATPPRKTPTVRPTHTPRSRSP